jgi:hypothetical protein
MRGRKFVRAVALSATVAVLWSAPSGIATARASPLLGPDFRVSGERATDSEWTPEVAWNAIDNEYLVVWQDWRSSETRGADIYGRRVGPDGSPIGGDLRISGFRATADERNPAVTWSAERNEYLVVWEDDRFRPTRGTDIRGRRVAADGRRLGNDFPISGSRATACDCRPAVTWNAAASRYLVVWEDGRNQAARGFDVYGRVIRPNGKRLGPDFRISGNRATGSEGHPAVTWNATENEYFVVWQDTRRYATLGWEIFGRRLGGAATPLGGDRRLTGAGSTDDDVTPAVAWSPATNRYVVVWESARDAPSRGTDVYGRRVLATGAVAGRDFRISGRAATGDEGEPAIAWDGASAGFLVVWHDGRNLATRSMDVQGAWLHPNGFPEGGNFRISGPDAVRDEWSPGIAWNGASGEFLVVWQDWRSQAARDFDVYGRRIAG